MAIEPLGRATARAAEVLQRVTSDYDGNAANRWDEFRIKAKTDLIGYAQIFELLGVRPKAFDQGKGLTGRRLLDYGCGSSRCGLIALQQGAVFVDGVDTSRDMVAASRAHARPGLAAYHLEGTDLKCLPEGRTYTDAVMNFVMCAMEEDALVGAALRAIYERLEPGANLAALNVAWHRTVEDDGTRMGRGARFQAFDLDSMELPGEKGPTSAVLKIDGQSFQPISDVRRSRALYHQLLTEAGFQVVSIRENLAATPNPAWVEEDKKPPFITILARKPGGPSHRDEGFFSTPQRSLESRFLRLNP